MIKAEDILLTTKDNKFNPFTDEDNWRAFDTDYSHPYNTEAYYMRLLGLRNPDNFTPEMMATELMDIFEEIINVNKEMGIDIYELITRDGERLDHVPGELRASTAPYKYA
jgi:hypothetical protein